MYLPSIFSDNMVLQRGQQVPVWGWADTGREVTVRLGDQQQSMLVPDGGYWRVDFDPIQPGPPVQLTAGDGEQSYTCENVVAGDVWLCAGQSNMQFALERSDGADLAIAQANDDGLRLLRVPPVAVAEPQVHTEARWLISEPRTAGGFSAVGYHFGATLRKELDVPIGTIQTALGGSHIECWMSRSSLQADPDFKPILDRYDFTRAHMAVLGQAAKAQGKDAIFPQPVPAKQMVSGLFNGTLAPVIPYAIRGALWYQGESDPWRSYNYRRQLPAMIADWRKRWGRGQFPFLVVQLPNYNAGDQGESPWAEMRESQAVAVASVPNAAMTVNIDLGDPNDLHPASKQPIADRLAKVALREIYSRDVAAYGPIFDSFRVETDSIRVRFKHVEGGLKTRDSQPVKGFVLAGKDQRFICAQATIDGDSVLLHSDQIAEPVAARYAWANNPCCNLYNRADLPAAPFRTDDWPGVTDHRR